ncbi:beta-lactamase family protein [Serratia liquefaciens]|uniref:serine hydrolase domain-containing protein n=1 Tax=Serratia liquefaciens TaxID=614 RepID=UPI0011F2C623|nr:serine hydrolase domain-containing protein [Serratia liquefaciens]MBH2812353.1 beta-lactamase family protein [Serratia liquefaciens]QIC85332.1 beta-lactamase family protein [Serratia liquefaciens]
MSDYSYRPPTTEQLDQLLQYASNQQTTPFRKGLGVAICWDGGGFQEPGGIYRYGELLDWQGNPMEFNDNVLFKIASCSKTFTATAYAMALEAGVIDDAATVGDMTHYFDADNNFVDIPLLSLVNYTSGFPFDNGAAHGTVPSPCPVPYRVDEMFAFLSRNPFAPHGTQQRFTYSNLAFSLLGWLLASKISNGKFSPLIDGWIFRPLGMNDSRYCMPYVDGKAPEPPTTFPCCYSYNADDNDNIDDYQEATASAPQFDAYYGGGGVMTSPQDMLQWLRFNLGLNQNLPNSEALLQKLQTRSTDVLSGTSELCMAWFRDPATDSMPATLYKDGDLPGANSYILFIASDAPGQIPSPAGVSVLVNVEGLTVDNTTFATWLAQQVMAIMLGGEPPQG